MALKPIQHRALPVSPPHEEDAAENERRHRSETERAFTTADENTRYLATVLATTARTASFYATPGATMADSTPTSIFSSAVPSLLIDGEGHVTLSAIMTAGAGHGASLSWTVQATGVNGSTAYTRNGVSTIDGGSQANIDCLMPAPQIADMLSITLTVVSGAPGVNTLDEATFIVSSMPKRR